MKAEFGSDPSASTSTSACAASRASRTIGDVLGLACLIASLLLMSTGVRTVQAEDETRMSIDPQRVEVERQKLAAKTLPDSNEASVIAIAKAKAKAKADSEASRKLQAARDHQAPGVSATEIQPGVVVLNTRGFNYGPPPAAIDPAAMRVEKGPEPTR